MEVYAALGFRVAQEGLVIMKANRFRFRGLTAKGKMVHGECHADMEGTTAYYDEYSQRIAWFEGTAHHNVPVKNGTVGQSIGKTDTHSVEVFEGDIIKTVALNNDHNQKGAVVVVVVRRFQGNSCLCLAGQDSGVTYYPFCIIHTMEIIGNIHENPELLEAN